MECFISLFGVLLRYQLEKLQMPKTTIRVRIKQWDYFNAECKAASFRRDGFLDRVLPGEIAMLQKIPPCDDIGATWIKRHWIDQGNPRDTAVQPIPILLSDPVLASLNAICEKNRVPRDAFLDCALAYLTARLYDAVVVIKTPRTNRDLVSRVAMQRLQYKDWEATDEEKDEFVKEEVLDWAKEKDLTPLADDFYRQRLSFDSARVTAIEKENADLFRLLFKAEKNDTKPIGSSNSSNTDTENPT